MSARRGLGIRTPVRQVAGDGEIPTNRPASPSRIRTSGIGHHDCSQKAVNPCVPSRPAQDTPRSRTTSATTRAVRLMSPLWPGSSLCRPDSAGVADHHVRCCLEWRQVRQRQFTSAAPTATRLSALPCQHLHGISFPPGRALGNYTYERARSVGCLRDQWAISPPIARTPRVGTVPAPEIERSAAGLSQESPTASAGGARWGCGRRGFVLL